MTTSKRDKSPPISGKALRYQIFITPELNAHFGVEGISCFGVQKNWACVNQKIDNFIDFS